MPEAVNWRHTTCSFSVSGSPFCTLMNRSSKYAIQKVRLFSSSVTQSSVVDDDSIPPVPSISNSRISWTNRKARPALIQPRREWLLVISYSTSRIQAWTCSISRPSISLSLVSSTSSICRVSLYSMSQMLWNCLEHEAAKIHIVYCRHVRDMDCPGSLAQEKYRRWWSIGAMGWILSKYVWSLFSTLVVQVHL